MKQVLKDISSLYWWIGVVLVGIAINVASHYLQEALDTQLSSVSSWWRERSEAQRAQRLKELEKLCDNPHEQILLAFSEMQTRFQSIVSLTFPLLFLALRLFFDVWLVYYGVVEPSLFMKCLQIGTIALSGISLFMAYRALDMAVHKSKLLEDSRK